MIETIVGGLIAAGAGLSSTWASHLWSQRERSAERRDVRRIAMLAQRAADLRELGVTLTEMVAASKEVIWERVTSGKPMPRSDPRAMRLTQLTHRSRFFRVVVGNEELRTLVGTASSAASRLSDSNVDDVDRDIASANQAMAVALDKVAGLLREVESV